MDGSLGAPKWDFMGLLGGSPRRRPPKKMVTTSPLVGTLKGCYRVLTRNFLPDGFLLQEFLEVVKYEKRSPKRCIDMTCFLT